MYKPKPDQECWLVVLPLTRVWLFKGERRLISQNWLVIEPSSLSSALSLSLSHFTTLDVFSSTSLMHVFCKTSYFHSQASHLKLKPAIKVLIKQQIQKLSSKDEKNTHTHTQGKQPQIAKAKNYAQMRLGTVFLKAYCIISISIILMLPGIYIPHVTR